MLANSEINFKLVFKIIGRLLFVESASLFFVLFISLAYGEKDGLYFLGTSLFALLIGTIFILIGRNAPNRVGKREGSLIVTFTWIVFSLVSALPFWLSNNIPSFTDAFFESMSGFTTTGASILNNVESLSQGMLFWRSFTHWLGGLGIIVISLAILPVFGVSGTQLFVTENIGPTQDKIHSKISETAKRLFYIYILLTVAETILLLFGHMNLFDAVCHSFGTISTGGFSTKQQNIAYYHSPYIEYVIIFFMILSGVNFFHYYYIYKRKFNKIAGNEELKYYFLALLFFSALVMLVQIDLSHITTDALEQKWRESFFAVTSLMTTTGMVTVNYMLWKPITWMIFLVIMIIGASAGSTSGGVKFVRIIISAKACYYEFKKLIHPTAIIPVRYNKHILREDTLTRVLAFVLLYLVINAIGIIILAASGMGFMESVGGMISCLGNVGPGLGMVGPTGNFSHIPEFSKWFLTLVMLAGRLELYTVLMLFTPAFWRK